VLAALVASLRGELAEAQAALARALGELAEARERIAELEAQLRQTPRNSSKPPSSEGLALARRLLDRQDDYLRFTRDFAVPPDNNEAVMRSVGVSHCCKPPSGNDHVSQGVPASSPARA
jgi:Family of unknown function (DUF6444)